MGHHAVDRHAALRSDKQLDRLDLVDETMSFPCPECDHPHGEHQVDGEAAYCVHIVSTLFSTRRCWCAYYLEHPVE